jgi:hypothetical protein
MAILFTDGFDWWDDSDDQYTWDNNGANPTITSVNSRRNAPSNQQQLANTNNQNARLAVQFGGGEFRNEVIVGYCLRINRRGGTQYGVRLTGQGIAQQVSWGVEVDGAIRFYRGAKATLLWESDPGIVRMNVYNHYEVRVRCDNTTGEYEIRLNGEQLVNASGVDTQAGSTSLIDSVLLGHAATNWHYYDDVYVLDKFGGVNDDFLGPAPYINTIHPSASGENTDWYPSAGDNWNCVDDGQDADTSDYIMVSGDYLVDGAKDTYIYDDVENWSDTIYGVSFSQIGRDWTTSGEALSLMRLGAAEFNDSGENVLRQWRTEYGYANRWMYIWDKNPSGEITWTETDINNAEFGVEWQA